MSKWINYSAHSINPQNLSAETDDERREWQVRGGQLFTQVSAHPGVWLGIAGQRRTSRDLDLRVSSLELGQTS